jgi:hypothetical protein
VHDGSCDGMRRKMLHRRGAVVGECGRKWPESRLAVQIPCNPVTLCRSLCRKESA